jgi:hypothetical protein
MVAPNILKPHPSVPSHLISAFQRRVSRTVKLLLAFKRARLECQVSKIFL